MKRFLAFACGMAGALSLLFSALLLAVWLLGTQPAVMLPLMRHDAPPEAAGLPQERYPEAVEVITGYLSGRTDVFQLAGPEGKLLFHDYEQAHMRDCRALFGLVRTALRILLPLAGLCAAGALLLRGQTRFLRLGVRWSLLAAGALFAALLIWALADFDGLFVRFHQTFFTNDLWLLNPQTDLLVRLMPLPYFIHCALILAIAPLPAVALLLFLARAPGKRTGTGASSH